MAFDQKKLWSRAAAKAAEHHVLAALGACLLILVLGYLVIFAPALRRIQAANRSVFLESETKAKRQYLSEMATLVENYQKIPTDDVEKIRAMIPFEDDTPGLLATIEALGQQNDIAVTSVNFSGGLGDDTAPAGGGLKTLTISMNLEHADYDRFKLFLESIERHLRIFDIVSMSMNPSGAQYALTIRTYVHPPLTK